LRRTMDHRGLVAEDQGAHGCRWAGQVRPGGTRPRRTNTFKNHISRARVLWYYGFHRGGRISQMFEGRRGERHNAVAGILARRSKSRSRPPQSSSPAGAGPDDTPLIRRGPCWISGQVQVIDSGRGKWSGRIGGMCVHCGIIRPLIDVGA